MAGKFPAPWGGLIYYIEIFVIGVVVTPRWGLPKSGSVLCYLAQLTKNNGLTSCA
jgi:hypothetical protein